MRPTRILEIRPGYDCKFAPCEHERKGDHGIHGEEWVYVVTDRRVAVNLTIYTGRLPATVPAEHAARCADMFPMPADLGLHTQNPRYDAHDPMRSCLYIAGPCFYDGSGLRAVQFWNAHGDASRPEQREEFWQALEAQWASDKLQFCKPERDGG